MATRDPLLDDNPWTAAPDPYAPAPASSADLPGWPADPSTAVPTAPPPTVDQGPAAGPSPDFTTDLGPTSSSTTPPAAPAPDYSSHLTAITQAPDPQTSAVATDALKRQLVSDLTADGHVVKWQGDTLVVDGLPYVLPADRGGSDPPDRGGTPPAGPTDGTTPLPPDGTTPPAGPPDGTTPPGTPPRTFFNPLTGQAGFTPNVPFTGNNFQEFVQGLIGQLGLVGHQADTNPLALLAIVEGLNQNNVNASLDTRADGLHKGIMLNGKFVKLLDGNDHWIWDEGGATTGAPAPPPLGLEHDPNYARLLHWLDTTPLPDATAPAAPPGWGVDDVFGKLTAEQPGDADTAKLVQSILEHPESLSDTDVERLKSKNAEEAAIAAQSADEELQHFGYGSGLQDSPWLASQRASNAFNRRSATISSNRDIDITAANQRQADRLKAADIGRAFGAYRHSTQQTAVNSAVLLHQGPNFGLELDARKLREQSEQFRGDLLSKIAELKQQDDQFRARYGLDAQELQRRKDQDAFNDANTAAGR
jgi:hypothetical protein